MELPAIGAILSTDSSACVLSYTTLQLLIVYCCGSKKGTAFLKYRIGSCSCFTPPDEEEEKFYELVGDPGPDF